MLRLVQTLTFSAAVWSALASCGTATEVAWHSDLASAFQVAQASNRPVLIHFWTPECVPCRRLEQNVFNQPQVTKALSELFVPVKVNANAHPELAARYRITSVPKDVIVTPANQEIHRLFTPQDPDQYVAQLTAVSFRTDAGPTDTALAQQSSGSQLPPMNSQVPPVDSQDNFASYAKPTTSATPTVSSTAGYVAEEEPREVINRYARKNASPEVEPPSDEYARRSSSPATEATAGGGPRQSRWGAWPEDGAMNQPVGKAAASEDEYSRYSSNEPANSATAQTAPKANTPPASSQQTLRPSPEVGPIGGPASDAMQVAERQPAAGTATSSQTPPIGMDGYCPVTLLTENKWVKGDPKYGVIHRGRTYLFVGSAEKDQFFADPDEFSPVLAGIDPVRLADNGQTVEGNRAHGVVYRKRVYLFSDESNLKRFWEDPEHYAAPIRQAMESNDLNRLFR